MHSEPERASGRGAPERPGWRRCGDCWVRLVRMPACGFSMWHSFLNCTSISVS